MFGPRINLFKLFGFPIRLDLSWIFIAILLTWSLAAAYFPQVHPGLGEQTYWIMGLIGMLGLFASVVLHELGHAIVARKYDLEIRGITLFIFGGVAEMMEESRSAKAEFFVAIGGPLVSLALAIAFWGISGLGMPEPVSGVIRYLAVINTVLLVFNMIPAFPLDGGRVLRAILWHFGKSLRKATRTCSRIGSIFGWALIGMGLLQLLAGYIIGAVWWALLGMFLRGAASSAYQQLLLRRLLEGEPVSRFMRTEPVSVSEDDSLRDIVEDYVYKFHYKTFPVTDDSGRLTGTVSTRQIKDIPREEWGQKRVGDVMESMDDKRTLNPDDDALRALTLMNRHGSSRLMVVRDGRLEGILALKDLMELFSLKIELEEDEPARAPL